MCSRSTIFKTMRIYFNTLNARTIIHTMAKKILLISLIFLLILVSGCTGFDYGDTWRTYNHSVSKNVTIDIYKADKDNLTILESKTDFIQVKEDVFYQTRSWVKNDTGNVILIEDYVKFVGDKDNLKIYISLARTSDEDSNVHKAYANVFIYLPSGTNYTINYLSSPRYARD